MSPTMAMSKANDEDDDHTLESQYQKGVKHLCENGKNKVPRKYILSDSDRPINADKQPPLHTAAVPNLKLPIVDFSELQGPNRSQVLKSLSDACEQYGFFQVVNHGISSEVIRNMIDVSTRFFALPIEERSKYMSSDMSARVRYGTSFNQNKDSVFCWRDFLKLMCHPISEVLPLWPSSPPDWRRLATTYAEETKYLFMKIVEAILESLGLWGATATATATAMNNKTEEDGDGGGGVIKRFEDGSQLMVVNYYPACPEPELTLGMPPHSDYGFLTLLLQDDVQGLQIQHQQKWVTVQPIPDSFVVNVGDHLEIFSNGRYKSVLHRVLVNSAKPRISVASLHSLPLESTVRPSPALIDEANPRRYKDTDFSSFLDYISSCEPKSKNFLESRKLMD